MHFLGYKRQDGSVGIRNKILIIVVDECCDGIAQQIAKNNKDAVVLTNWYTCMLGGNEETFNQLIAVGENPNVCGAIVIAMGCGSILTSQIADPIRKLGKPVYELTCQKEHGTRSSIKCGIEYLEKLQEYASSLVKEKCEMSSLIVGVKCGGSDTSSGIASNPSAGLALDKLIDLGGIGIGGELLELIGCEEILKKRAVSESVGKKIVKLIDNEKARWNVEGTQMETMSIGNSVGGLTTLEEKSLGALHKMGHKPIQDILQVNKDFVDKPKVSGFYLSEATMLCGGSGINFASYGAHMILWTSGGAGFSNPLVPVIRISGNEELFNEDMDIDARPIMNGTASIQDIADIILQKMRDVADGTLTAIEDIGSSTMTLYQKDQRVETLLKLDCA